jgi:hypothetical protein
MEQVQSKSNASRKTLSNILILLKKTIGKGIAAKRRRNKSVVKGGKALQ